MRLFGRKKKKETPGKARPASVYYSPAAASAPAASTPTAAAAAAQTPWQTPTAAAAQTAVPTLWTPVQLLAPGGGDAVDAADLRGVLSRTTIEPKAKRRLEALLDRLEAAELAAATFRTPRRQVSWSGTIEKAVTRPSIAREWSWRRAPSTPTTPSKHLLLAFGLGDATKSPKTRRRRRGYLFTVAGAVACACAGAGAAPIISRRRAAAALKRATEHADTEIQDTVHTIQAACLPVTKHRPLARLGCGARITFARFRKHIAKLIVLVVMGFSPLPFLLSFV